MDKPKICEGECVPKGWGEEIIIANNKDYCGKVLVFNDSGKVDESLDPGTSQIYEFQPQWYGKPRHIEIGIEFGMGG